MRHALCLDCGSVLHVPWSSSSSPEASEFLGQLLWTARLAAGCADCGGRLSTVKLDGCTECAGFLRVAH